MFDVNNLSTISKAIAGGLVSLVVAELARYGFHPGNEVITAGGVIVTALVSYLAGHIAVYLAPKNKTK